MKHSWIPARLWQLSESATNPCTSPYPVITVVNPDPDVKRCIPPDPLTPIWTPSQSLGNNATWQSVHKTNTHLLLSHNSYSCKIVYSFPPALTLEAIHKTCSILNSFITVSTWNDWRECIPRNTTYVYLSNSVPVTRLLHWICKETKMLHSQLSSLSPNSSHKLKAVPNPKV